jgi:hypothetical protein
MITLGIDLAAKPKKTAVSRVHWADGGGEVELVKPNVTDGEITALAGSVDKIGIRPSPVPVADRPRM